MTLLYQLISKRNVLKIIWIASFKAKTLKLTKTIQISFIQYMKVKTQKHSIKLGSKNQKLTWPCQYHLKSNRNVVKWFELFFEPKRLKLTKTIQKFFIHYIKVKTQKYSIITGVRIKNWHDLAYINWNQTGMY